ncbi:MAG TPA: RNA 2',3'-cyclic phosphodiesterase [Firmicutes bacterium]|nr:RNA 2',3'-cyclic phosphodiesterase [Bacillota bacterium]
MDTVRCFVAVFLHPSLHREIAAIQKRLSHSGADVKWVEPCNLHFTLQFLGDVEAMRIPGIADALRECVADSCGFELELDSVGAFPHLNNPRVLWVDVGTGRERLVSLMSTVGEAMKMEGFARDKKGLSPHLTIGRVRSPRNLKALLEKLNSGMDITGKMEVTKIQFTASELTPRGPVYSPIDVIPLHLPSEI